MFNPLPQKLLNEPPGTTASSVRRNQTGPCENPESCNSAIELSSSLQNLLQKLRTEFMTDEGRSVKYIELKDSPFYTQLLDLVQRLKVTDIRKLNQEQRKVFFINVYNVLTIHGVLANNIPSSVLQVQQFWRVTSYNIGSFFFSLEDIQHGILRGNRPHPAAQQPPFDVDDERLQFVVPLDPRVHFVLSQAAKSCPPIHGFSAESLEQTLNAATADFCRSQIRVEAARRRVWLSRLFQWYQKDFGGDYTTVMRWVCPWVDERTRYGLIELLDLSPRDGPTDVIYSDYNWKLNKAS